MHGAVGAAREGFTREGQQIFLADAIAQRDEVSVLKRCHAHLGLVQTLGPLAHRPGLGDDHKVGASDRERAHVLRIVPVVADGHADSAGARVVDRRARVARRVVALLVEARVFGDVDHPRAPKQPPVRIDDWRAVVRATALPLEEVENDDHAELTRRRREGIDSRSRNGLSQSGHIRTSGPLRMKWLERQLRETDERSPFARGRFECAEAALDVRRPVGRRVLLDECDSHVVI